jgi:hypothetical protein
MIQRSLFSAGLAVLAISTSAQTVRLGTADGYVVAHLTDQQVKGRMHPERSYHWVRAQAMQVTQGGAGGTLLHGPYQAYHVNGQLREQGAFDRGLKDGEWRLWTSEGGLVRVERWKDGRLHGLSERYTVADTIVQERYRNGALVKQKERKPKGEGKNRKKQVKEDPSLEKGATGTVPAEGKKSRARKERPPRSEKGAPKGNEGMEKKKKEPAPKRERPPKKDERP